jgi:hypothetical protein
MASVPEHCAQNASHCPGTPRTSGPTYRIASLLIRVPKYPWAFCASNQWGETRDAPALYKTSADARPSLYGERIMYMETSKSTLTVAQEALKAGQESLRDYRRPKSPKKFTQPQLFACLVVKEFRRLDYRGIWVLLLEWSGEFRGQHTCFGPELNIPSPGSGGFQAT